MNKRPTIAVDIDDVIAAHAPAFIKWTNEKYGTNLTVNDYQDHWGEVWKVDYEEREKRALEYHQTDYIGTYGAVDGASEVLAKLKDKFKLVVLTTRRKSIDQLTRDWLERYYPNAFDEVVFSGFFDVPHKDNVHLTKGEMAKSIGADYLIDDQLKHCEAAAQLGIKGVLFGDYPWNQAPELPEGVTRVKNWKEVLEYFDVQ